MKTIHSLQNPSPKIFLAGSEAKAVEDIATATATPASVVTAAADGGKRPVKRRNLAKDLLPEERRRLETEKCVVRRVKARKRRDAAMIEKERQQDIERALAMRS
jgi:hypothetical protein